MSTSRQGDAISLPSNSILNLRDVASIINKQAGHQIIEPSLLYRSARPDNATPEDRHYLTLTLGIKSIIDLRSPTEHAEAQTKHSTRIQQQRRCGACTPPTPPVPSPPGFSPEQEDSHQALRIPGIEYHDINLNGSAYTNALLSHLTWPQTLRLYALYALGWRKDAIAILGTNVMAPRGLSGLAIDTLTYSTSEIKEAFMLLAEEDNWPVLVHCTQGKDRTGLLVLLVLLLCGVDAQAIEKDYMASQAGLAAEREGKVKEAAEIGLPEAFADCEIGWTGKVIEWIETRKGAKLYLEQKCGVGSDIRERLRRKLLTN